MSSGGSGMRVARLTLATLILLVSAVYVTAQGTAAPPESPLACTISMSNTSWHKGGTTAITVRLRNSSPVDLDLGAYPVLILSKIPDGPPDSYWTPIDLPANKPAAIRKDRDTTITPLPAHLHIPKKSAVEFVVDADHMKWDRQISSTWPNRAFWKTIPSGEYSLWLEVGTKDSGIKSNELRLTIREK
jgi:hypothetical protein